MNNRAGRYSKFILSSFVILSLMDWAQAFPAREGEPCGPASGLQCGEKLWCDRQSNRCDAVETDGVCIKVPEVCDAVIVPVCGCNNTTYDNNCQRQKAGVQKLKDGPC